MLKWFSLLRNEGDDGKEYTNFVTKYNKQHSCPPFEPTCDDSPHSLGVRICFSTGICATAAAASAVSIGRKGGGCERFNGLKDTHAHARFTGLLWRHVLPPTSSAFPRGPFTEGRVVCIIGANFTRCRRLWAARK